MAYATRTDVEVVYGKHNVRLWADVDNDNDTARIEERITWANNLAKEKVDTFMRGGHYEIPFVTPYPVLIVNLAAMIAGTILYDARRLIDSSDDGDEISPQRRMINQIKQDLTSGRALLDLDTAKRFPEALKS